MSDNSYGTTFGPSAPGAINLVAGDTGDVDTAHLANNPSIATSTSPNADLTAERPRRLLADERRPALLGRLLDARRGRDEGHEHRRRAQRQGPLLGLVPGRLPAERRATRKRSRRPATAGQSTSTFIPDEFSLLLREAEHRPAHSCNQGNCYAVHPVGVALGGTGQWGYKDDYIAHHEPFQYYASTANPHHLTIPTNGSGQDTLAGLQSIGHDTQSYVGRRAAVQHAEPQLRHERLQPARRSDQPPRTAGLGAARRELPEGAGLPGRPRRATPTRPTSRRSSTSTINELMRSPDWKSTAVFVNYDDSDGWYDHAYSGVTQPVAVAGGQPHEHVADGARARAPRASAARARRRSRRSPANRAAAASARACRCC